VLQFFVVDRDILESLFDPDGKIVVNVHCAEMVWSRSGCMEQKLTLLILCHAVSYH